MEEEEINIRTVLKKKPKNSCNEIEKFYKFLFIFQVTQITFFEIQPLGETDRAYSRRENYYITAPVNCQQ